MLSPYIHCPKNSMNLCITIERDIVGADATVYVGFLGPIHVNKSRTYSVASAADFRHGVSDYFFPQCTFATTALGICQLGR